MVRRSPPSSSRNISILIRVLLHRFDECDGQTTSDCGDTPPLDNVGDILLSQGRNGLYNTMNIYWPDMGSDNNVMWSHEWSKHGSCANTIEPGCYGDSYTENVQVGDWAQTVVDLFMARDTYQTLAAKGIVPGGWYTKEAIHAALQPIHGGMTPAIACRFGSQWTEVYYYYYLTGNIINGDYTPVEASKSFSLPLSAHLVELER